MEPQVIAEHSDIDADHTEAMRLTEGTGLGKQSLLQLAHVPDDGVIQQQQLQSVACEDRKSRDDSETGPCTTRPPSEGAQPPPLTQHPAAPKGRKSEHQDAADLCNVAADAEGTQQHSAAAHEGAAPTVHMPKGLSESSRLSFGTVALLRHGIAVWSTRAQGRAWCLRLGMTASSWDGWAKMHVHPLAAMRFYFLPAVGDLLARAYVFTGLSMNVNSLLFYVVTLPQTLVLAAVAAVNCAMFRFGPQIVYHRMYQPIVTLNVCLSLPVTYVGYIGPQDTVPWNNRFKFLVVCLAAVLFQHLAAAAGALPGEHPVEPRTSIQKPVLRAIIQTLRLTDSLTDLSLIAELVTERRHGCWMFGVPGRCGAWNWLIGLFCTFAAIDLILALATSLSGRESLDSNQAQKRTYLACQCTALLCELGIVACTLVHLYNLRHPGNAAREDFSPAQQHNNLGLTFASLATTLFTFTFNLVDTSKTLAAARSAVARVSGTGFKRSQITPQASHTTS